MSRSNAIQEIQDIKAKVGQSAETIIASGLNLRPDGKKYHCPNSIYHKNGDRTGSLSWDPNRLNFHCFGCPTDIDIYNYYREYLNYTHGDIVREILGKEDYKKNVMDQNRNTFKQKITKLEPITAECIEYLGKRGITKETLDFFSIVSFEGKIAFPYFKGDTPIGYKIRMPVKNPPKPKMTSIPGSKPFLFNSHTVQPGGDELIICEGESDCMVIWQCGYKNVVSVGAGANSMNAILEQAKDYLNSFKTLVIVSDNDEAGTNMDQIFIETFGSKAKLIDKKLYHRKDINEEYVLHGVQSVQEIIESGRWKIEGRRDLDKKPYKGLQSIKGNYIPTGIPTVDNALNDLVPGCVTLITGRSNGGKTTFTKQVMANAINRGNKIYLISGEGSQERLINELYQCVVGKNEKYYNVIKINKKYHKEPKPEVLNALRKWHENKLVLFNKGESNLKTIPELFDMLEQEVKINRYDLIVIDNLMSILNATAAEKYEQQAEFMQRLCDLSKIYNCHIILVLHPNKTYQKETDMDFEQISGTSDLPNKADNIISVNRIYAEDKNSRGINGKIAVIKNRYYPDLVSCDLFFEKETGLLLERAEGGYISYGFNWEQYLPNYKQINIPGFTPIDDSEEQCPF